MVVRQKDFTNRVQNTWSNAHEIMERQPHLTPIAMNITLKQIKKDIRTGKSLMIFYSQSSYWWTHDHLDLVEASKKGRIAQARAHGLLKHDPLITEERRKQLDSKLKKIRNIEGIPLDPLGSPLLQTDKPLECLMSVENNPEHFGDHGMDAFLLAHHQNCEGSIFREWEPYNRILDELNETI